MGRPVALNKGSAADGVSVFSNVANKWTSILSAKTPKSRSYTWPNGDPFTMKLCKNDGSEISAVSQLIPGYTKPGRPLPVQVGGTRSYAAWRFIPLTSVAGEPTQHNVETSSNRRMPYESGQPLTLPQDWEYHILLNSPDVVDWTHPNTFWEQTVYEGDGQVQVLA